MSIVREALRVWAADPFWGQVREVAWWFTETDRGTGLTVQNPSDHEIGLLALVLEERAAVGNHGAWVPGERVVLSAKRGSPTVLDHPVLRPGERASIPPRQERTLDLPDTVGFGAVRSVVLTSVLDGKAVKYWRLGRAGAVDVLRDDRIRFAPGDLVEGFFALLPWR